MTIFKKHSSLLPTNAASPPRFLQPGIESGSSDEDDEALNKMYGRLKQLSRSYDR